MHKELITALAWGGGIVGLALGATLARKLGYIDSETVTRLVIGANGLMMAWYGNLMPKVIAPSSVAQQVLRVGGWSMAISGIVYTALWAFAPTQVAVVAGCGVVLAGMAVTLGNCLVLRAKAKTS